MKVEHIGPESLIRNFRRTLTYHLEGTARLLPFEMRGVISWNNRENSIQILGNPAATRARM